MRWLVLLVCGCSGEPFDGAANAVDEAGPEVRDVSTERSNHGDALDDASTDIQEASLVDSSLDGSPDTSVDSSTVDSSMVDASDGNAPDAVLTCEAFACFSVDCQSCCQQLGGIMGCNISCKCM